jgi:hypothetical protein
MSLPNNAEHVFTVINMLTGSVHERLGTRCWPFTNKPNKDGRPYYRVSNKNYLAYRLVYELVNGELDPKLEVRHKCDNPLCCNPAHLETGTKQENMNDMKERERHGLPHHTVRAIRKAALRSGVTHADIAEIFGLGRSTVTEIINRDNYDHVKDDEDERDVDPKS